VFVIYFDKEMLNPQQYKTKIRNYTIRGHMGHALPPIISPTLWKGHVTVESTWWRPHRNTNRVFGYLSVILAPFGTVFGYFWLKTSGNPGSHVPASPPFSIAERWLLPRELGAFGVSISRRGLMFCCCHYYPLLTLRLVLQVVTASLCWLKPSVL